MPSRKKISGWAKFPESLTELITTSNTSALQKIVTSQNRLIARGNGMSYGDLSFSSNKTIDTRNLNNIISFDEDSQTIEWEAGVLLSEINTTLHPKDYKLFVIPGTKFISLGGAIACDVHGKNQSTYGSFCNHLISFKLLVSSGKIINCSQNENKEYFINTIGGLGLTGIIISAKLNIRKISSNTLLTSTTKTNSIPKLIELMIESSAEYKAAWIKNPKQILYTEGNYIKDKNVFRKEKIKSIKYNFLGLATNKYVLKLVEFQLFKSAKEDTKEQSENDFLHPLDNVLNWNKLYTNGFIQVQFVVSKKDIEKAIDLTYQFIKKQKLTSFLTTLKLFNKTSPSIGTMSFVEEGFVFSIDIKYETDLEKKLQILADEVSEMGGKFYLAKDSFLKEKHLIESYKNYSEFKSFITQKTTNKFESDFWKRIKSQPMKTLILGANSDIGKAIAIELKDEELILASRNIKALKKFTVDNQLNAQTVHFDALDYASHQVFFDTNKNINKVICVFGYLGSHEKAKKDFTEAKKIIETNYLGAVSILDKYALFFKEEGKGEVIGISSVAADRGRQSNYYYGSAKAGFESYLSGLRNRLHSSGVNVLTVKPGFVRTKMIEGIDTPSFLTAQPKQVAQTIVKSSKKGRNVIYVSGKWYWIMSIIKTIPEFIFKKLNL